jgi:pyruvate formate lyase activating enzyme
MRKTSLVDYPGKISGALFFPGCGLRCPWCHNRELVAEGLESGGVSLDEALGGLEKRRNVLGGAVLSGGEPTLYRELPSLVERIKALGLLVKIDTNGMDPAMLERLLRTPETSPDYIALDLKTAPRRYVFLSYRGPGDPEKNLNVSAEILRGSGIAHEFRTLAFPHGFVTEEDIEDLAPLTDDAPWYFRPFRPGNCLDPGWNALEAASSRDVEVLARRAAALGKQARQSLGCSNSLTLDKTGGQNYH